MKKRPGLADFCKKVTLKKNLQMDLSDSGGGKSVIHCTKFCVRQLLLLLLMFLLPPWELLCNNEKPLPRR